MLVVRDHLLAHTVRHSWRSHRVCTAMLLSEVKVTGTVILAKADNVS